MVESSRLFAAYERARRELLEERVAAGHWVGQLSTSALSTATAVSALAVVGRRRASPTATSKSAGEAAEGSAADRPYSSLIDDGIRWLARHQNEDGGWGDTPKSYSNISTTMLNVAAFHLAEAAGAHAERLRRAEAYVQRAGGVPGLRARYGRDKTFAVPILTNCALAGLVAWREVAALPFELACLPQSFYRFARLPVVSYAIPALVAIGQVRHGHARPFNPLLGRLRDACVEPSLRVLRRMQPASGGYLEAVPLTSFVVMSLADLGRVEHPVTKSGVEFLLESARDDGSWPIDTNLATWNTTLSLNALAQGDTDIGSLGCLDWLLDCQHHEPHPFTGASPGGWGWSDLSGAVPDADDTPGALLALDAWRRSAECGREQRRRIERAAMAGCRWLLELQNRDGGWPTFCRGWGKLPFDRSGADLTAHALRALAAWRPADASATGGTAARWSRAMRRGLRYLEKTQAADGSWAPLWFGNQDHPREENPVYGTAKVLLAYGELGLSDSPAARRGRQWLNKARNADGGWGGGPGGSSVEETAVATEALLATRAGSEAASERDAAAGGINWLVEAVEAGRWREPSPIGFYFAKLWYYEDLYPLVFTVSALGRAVRSKIPPAAQAASQIPPADKALSSTAKR